MWAPSADITPDCVTFPLSFLTFHSISRIPEYTPSPPLSGSCAVTCRVTSFVYTSCSSPLMVITGAEGSLVSTIKAPSDASSVTCPALSVIFSRITATLSVSTLTGPSQSFHSTESVSEERSYVPSPACEASIRAYCADAIPDMLSEKLLSSVTYLLSKTLNPSDAFSSRTLLYGMDVPSLFVTVTVPSGEVLSIVK